MSRTSMHDFEQAPLVTTRIAETLSEGKLSVQTGDERWDTSQLTRWAANCATKLERLGVGKGDRVVLHAGPSAAAIVGLLAIWQQGAAVVPMDPDDHSERQEAIFSRARASAVLCQSADSRYAHLPEAIDLDLLRDDQSSVGKSPSDWRFETRPDDDAYVIFTSGTTGAPKGVVVDHQSLANYAQYATDTYLDDRTSPVLLHGSLAFDMSITSLVGPPMTGNPIVTCSSHELPELISQGTTFAMIKVTPSHLRMLDRWPGSLRAAPAAKSWVIGGEALHWSDVNSWIESAPNSQFFNEYGPTEATVGCVVHEIEAAERDLGDVPIGTAIPGVSVRILNEYQAPCSIGETGELYIGGNTLAVGYFDDPGTTSQKFVRLEEAHRYYRTGDLVEESRPGFFTYHGRTDGQVKLMGHRVDLREIERVARGCEGVDSSVAVVQQSQERNVVLLYVAGSRSHLPCADLVRNELASKLPGYMQPSAVCPLGFLPIAPSGKVDTSALPEPPAATGQTNVDAVLGTETERRIADVWAQLLEIDALGIGRTDDFFALGGHSLLATELVSEIHQRTGVLIRLVDVFRQSQLADLAERVDTAKRSSSPLDNLARLHERSQTDGS